MRTLARQLLKAATSVRGPDVRGSGEAGRAGRTTSQERDRPQGSSRIPRPGYACSSNPATAPPIPALPTGARSRRTRTYPRIHHRQGQTKLPPEVASPSLRFPFFPFPFAFCVFPFALKQIAPPSALFPVHLQPGSRVAMPNASRSVVLQTVRTLFHLGTSGECSDGDLLDRFLSSEDEGGARHSRCWWSATVPWCSMSAVMS